MGNIQVSFSGYFVTSALEYDNNDMLTHNIFINTTCIPKKYKSVILKHDNPNFNNICTMLKSNNMYTYNCEENDDMVTLTLINVVIPKLYKLTEKIIGLNDLKNKCEIKFGVDYPMQIVTDYNTANRLEIGSIYKITYMKFKDYDYYAIVKYKKLNS